MGDKDQPRVDNQVGEPEGNSYIVNELLCYACQYMRISTREQLQKTLMVYYEIQDIIKAKQIVCSTYASIGEFSQRRSSKERSEKQAHIEDILNAIYDLDALDADFRFVALNLRNVPKWDPNNTDNFALAEKLSLLEGRIASMELTASENKIDVINCKDSISKAEKRLNNTDQDIAVLYNKTSSYADKIKIGTPNSQLVHQPEPLTAKISVPADCRPDTAEHERSSPSFFNKIFPRLSPPKVDITKQKTIVDAPKKSEAETVQSAMLQLRQDSDGFQFQRRERLRQQKEKRSRTVVAGTGRSTRLRGGPPPIRKFFVYRVDKTSTVEDIEAHLTEQSVVYNDVCLLSNPEARFNSFRVDVPLNMMDKVMDDSMWPEGIRIRKYFPPKTDNGSTV
jgi:hypothetical protein